MAEAHVSLRLRISLWMVAVTAAFTLLAWGALRLVVIPSFVELDHEIARQSAVRLTDTLARERDNLRVRCLEWANWDDTYAFIQTGDATFPRDNLNAAWFTSLRISFMLFYDLDGHVVWGEMHSPANRERPVQIADAQRFLDVEPAVLRNLALGERTLQGVTVTPAGPMLVAGHSVHKSDRSGVSVGAVVLGSLLDYRQLAGMAGLPCHAVRVWELASDLPPSVAAVRAHLDHSDRLVFMDGDQDACSTFLILDNYAQRPVLLAEMLLTRDITKHGRAACQFALYLVLIVGLLSLLFVGGLLNRAVVRPVLRVIDHVVSVARTNDLQRRIPGTAPGELGTLLGEFNHMLDRLAEDHTRRVEAEASRSEAEARYRRMFEDSVVALFQSTPDGRHIHVNNAFARLLGYTDAGDFKAALTNVAATLYVNPGQRAEILRRIEVEGPLTAFEIQFRRKDGSACWVSLTASIERDEAGAVCYYEGSIEDITQRKQAQDELHKLSRAVDQSPASIVITDPTGRIEYVNRKFVEVSEYTAAEAQGRTPAMLKSGLMPERVYHELWQTILDGREWRGELQNRRKSGDLYWEWVSISPLLDMQGKVTHFLAVKEDITHRKEADETLRRSLEQVERFNRLAIGREKRIIELKAAVNDLLAQIGEPPRYQVGLGQAVGASTPLGPEVPA